MTARFVLRMLLLLAAAGFADVARANPGDLDPTFGNAGRTFVDIPEDYESATSLVQARDGKLLLGRSVYWPPRSDDFSVMRLDVNGAFDPTFDGDGRTAVRLTGLEGVTRTVLELSNGRIIAAGDLIGETDGALRGYGLVRLEATGTRDLTFGDAGVAMGELDELPGSIQEVVEQPDGRLVAAGYVEQPGGVRDIAIARFDTTGSLDPTFGTNGLRRIDFFADGNNDLASELVQQTDGKLVAAGLAHANATVRALVLVRLTADGTLDATFGTDGKVALELPDLAQARISLRSQGDGKLVLSAQTKNVDTCGAAIFRVNPDGSLDSTFGADGIVHLPLGSCVEAGASRLELEPDGALTIANTVAPQTYPSDVKVTRFTPAGEIDATFGAAGTAIVEMGRGGWSSHVDPYVGPIMARQSDGRLVLAVSDQFGWEIGGDFFMVARLLASGSSTGVIGFTSNFVVVEETTATVTLTVRRTGGAAGAASVDFRTVPQAVVNAADAADYAPASGTLTWADGDVSDRTITIAILDDAESDSDEVFGVILSDATGAPLATTDMIVIIQDDESPAPPPPAPTPPRDSYSGGGGFDWALLLVLGWISASCMRNRRRRYEAARTHAAAVSATETTISPH